MNTAVVIAVVIGKSSTNHSRSDLHLALASTTIILRRVRSLQDALNNLGEAPRQRSFPFFPLNAI
jgi:hypothetical protein